jgi:hypothetical protein
MSVHIPVPSGTLARAGVGFHDDPNSRNAAAEAARQAVRQAGEGRIDVAFMYSTSRHDPGALLEGLRSVVGAQSRIVGGAATGVLTNGRLGYEGYQVGVAVLGADGLEVHTSLAAGLDIDEFDTGQRLGRQIAAASPGAEASLFFMYDMVKKSTPQGAVFNLATSLIRGMDDALPYWPATAGLGMIGDFQFNPTFQFFDDRVEKQSALALLLKGQLRMDTVQIHGCRPSSTYRTITKADENTILEIDGRPAVDVIHEIVGAESETDWQSWPIFLTLGVNRGDKFGEFREDDYAIRLCMGVDRERGGLVMFGDDLRAGLDIQVMRRNIRFDYIPDRVEGLFDSLRGRRPVLALYIDCSGRASAFSGTEQEDAEVIQRVIGDRIPLLGMYSGAEIAKVGDTVQANNWTGVLCVFSEPEPDS